MYYLSIILDNQQSFVALVGGVRGEDDDGFEVVEEIIDTSGGGAVAVVVR